MSDDGHSMGFPPIVSANARILVLGSLPGVRSIEAQQYYAHPQNAFWRIIEDVFGISGSYEARCAGLRQQGVAVWDVLRSSVRPGSMDADIQTETARANDFVSFLAAHAGIVRIGFNGKKSEALFRKLVLPGLRRPPELVSLPSTSPAYASMPVSKKLEIWRSMLQHQV